MKYLKLFEQFSEWDYEEEEEDILSLIFETTDEEDGDYIKVHRSELVKYFEERGIEIEGIEINNTRAFDDEYELTASIYPISDRGEISQSMIDKITNELGTLYFIEHVMVAPHHRITIAFKEDKILDLY